MYTVLTQTGTCGHKHRDYNQAVGCLAKLEDNGIPAMISGIDRRTNLTWVRECLIAHTAMDEMAEVLEG
jgi:hypothetical protein